MGVDYTGAMLAHARKRVSCEGWQNVELIRADAARLELRRQFDAALCILAIGVIPDYRGVLGRMVSHIVPGG